MLRIRWVTRIVAVALAFAPLGPMVPALAVGGEGESWPSFNESDGCGTPWAIGPNAETSGLLDPDAILRGPQAAYFGRTVGQVEDSLVPWQVPLSNGFELDVHRRMLPALSAVVRHLYEATDRNWIYDISSEQSFGQNSRTVRGRFRVSQHTFGNAVDINSLANPLTHGPLVTDMPEWFIGAWTSAGFCWGGDWIDFSDAMHFSWRGPLFTDGYSTLPTLFRPLTESENFTRTIFRRPLSPAGEGVRFESLMDADGDGAVDVVRVSDRGSTLAIEVLSARTGFFACSLTSYSVPQQVVGRVAIPGDWDRDGIQDLWILDDERAVTLTPLLANDRFKPGVSVTVDTSPGDVYLSADFDVDGWSDLYILRRLEWGWSVEVRGGAGRFSSIVAEFDFIADHSSHFTTVDRDLDLVPDLVAISDAGVVVFEGASGERSTIEGSILVDGMSDVAGTDFDGDGRHDIVTIRNDVLDVYSGNTPLDGVGIATWFLEEGFSCTRFSPFRATTFPGGSRSARGHSVPLM